MFDFETSGISGLRLLKPHPVYPVSGQDKECVQKFFLGARRIGGSENRYRWGAMRFLLGRCFFLPPLEDSGSHIKADSSCNLRNNLPWKINPCLRDARSRIRFEFSAGKDDSLRV